MDGCSQVVRPIVGSPRLVSEAFPAAASFCILILSRGQHQTWIKPLCPLNFGKTCLKLPSACGGTPPPSGTSWGHGGGRGGSSICFPLHPALAGWALGTDHLSIPHIVPIQSRDPETQGVSSKHYHRSICVPARKEGSPQHSSTWTQPRFKLTEPVPNPPTASLRTGTPSHPNCPPHTVAQAPASLFLCWSPASGGIYFPTNRVYTTLPGRRVQPQSRWVFNNHLFSLCSP